MPNTPIINATVGLFAASTTPAALDDLVDADIVAEAAFGFVVLVAAAEVPFNELAIDRSVCEEFLGSMKPEAPVFVNVTLEDDEDPVALLPNPIVPVAVTPLYRDAAAGRSGWEDGPFM
jgi:hypothetical protein